MTAIGPAGPGGLADLARQALADGLILVAGWRMASGEWTGRPWGVAGLPLAGVAAVASGGSGSAVEVALLLLVYLLVILSRFPQPVSGSHDRP